MKLTAKNYQNVEFKLIETGYSFNLIPTDNTIIHDSIRESKNATEATSKIEAYLDAYYA